MNVEQMLSVEDKLLEINNVNQKYTSDMNKLRKELIQHSVYFESYTEMYLFIKKHTPTLEAFNLDMLEAREIYENNRQDNES